ncbi:MAG TPA: hypothetical protein VIK08_12255 [Candidatus Limnocylindrales bacterium]
MSQFSGSSFGSYSRVYLIILGAIFLVVGIGVAIALGSLPYAGGGMLLMGGIFAIVGGILIVVGIIVGRGASATNQVLQTGIAGTATITGLTQTGVFFNDNPQIAMNLLVQLPGEVPYAASHREVVPLMLLGRLSSGAPLAVRVDQMDRSKIVIDWSNTGAVAPSPAATMAGVQQMAAAGGSQMDESLAQVQASLAGAPGMHVAQPFSTPDQANYTVEQLRAWLRQNGREAKAHVDQLEDTGKIVGDEKEFKVQVTLNISGEAPQQLPASVAMVPVAVAHKLFQGMDVPVRYAAQNHSLLMVEWDKV